MLDGDRSDNDDSLFLGNALRMAIMEGLTNLFASNASEDLKRYDALELIDGRIRKLQFSYEYVISEHVKLKKRLLDRRKAIS